MTNAATIEQLWHSLAAGLVRWFRSQGVQLAEAEDLVSETFVRVQTTLDSVRSEDRYAAWVRKVARNVLIDRRRSQPRPTELAETADPDEAVSFATIVASWLEPALREIDDPLTAEVLRRADLLGERQASVANELDLTVAAVKARVRRGRAQLRQILEACCTFEFDGRGGLLDAFPKRTDCACDD